LLNSSEILANVLGERLAEIYTRAFSSCEPRYAEIIGEAAKLVLERIGMSDALYHSAEHTALARASSMRSSVNSRRSAATSVSAMRRQQTSLINIPASSGAKWNRSLGARSAIFN
jgi:hypothetical protein